MKGTITAAKGRRMDIGKLAPKLAPALIEKRPTHSLNVHSPDREILRVPNMHTQTSAVLVNDGSPKYRHRVVFRAGRALTILCFSKSGQDQSSDTSYIITSPVKFPFKIK